MAVLALDHVNIRSRDPKRTLDFFREVLLMRVAGPAGLELSDEGGWIYDENDLPIVHVGSSRWSYPTDELLPYTPADGGGAVHHVALRCTDLEGTRDRLSAHGLKFQENRVDQIGLHQIFVPDPNGVLFELNFQL